MRLVLTLIAALSGCHEPKINCVTPASDCVFGEEGCPCREETLPENACRQDQNLTCDTGINTCVPREASSKASKTKQGQQSDLKLCGAYHGVEHGD